ncbi:MAG: Fe-S cluster assembly protein SufD [Vampirovibrio sp.]|nr:Fe-S cluster assembly protein SufD [Vampirovibrio sp.]
MAVITMQNRPNKAHKIQPAPTPFELAVLSDKTQMDAQNSAITTIRETGKSRYQQLGFPTRRLEAWKFIDLKALQNTEFLPYPDNLATVNKADLAPYMIGGNTNASRLVFVNGRYVDSLSNTAGIPKSITAISLMLASREMPTELSALENIFDATTDAFAALNAATVEDGVLLSIPQQTVVDKPIQILLVSTGDSSAPRMASPRCLVELGQGAKAELVVECIGLGKTGAVQPTVNNTVIQIAARPEAELRMTLIQEARHEATAYSFTSTEAKLEANSCLEMTTVALRGGIARHNVQAHLLEEGAHCTLNGLNVLNGDTKVHHHTEIHHLAPACTSEQVYKSILEDQSMADFDGTITVARHAQKTDSSQMNRTLLLSEDAKTYTRPQLKIDADDVKCAHGATVGQLEEEQLFYLVSRGLNPEIAQCLLTFGFAEDVINRINLPLVRQYLESRVLENMGQSHNPKSCYASCTKIEKSACEIEG